MRETSAVTAVAEAEVEHRPRVMRHAPVALARVDAFYVSGDSASGDALVDPGPFEAVVPEGCPGQVLQLEPVGMDEGTTFLAGTAWFDDLRLTRRR